MLYSCNKAVFLLEETSRTPGTGDRERLGTEWAVLPSRPTVPETGNALGRTGHPCRCVVDNGQACIGSKRKSPKQTGKPRVLGIMC